MSRAVAFIARASTSALRVAPRAPVARAPIARAAFAQRLSRGYASSAPKIDPTDPSLTQAQTLLEDGTRALEDNDLPRARTLYTESLGVTPTSGAYFNLGVVEYQLKNMTAAIEAWKSSISLEPSADAYTNLGSAYMMSEPRQPAEAIKALTAAMEITPNDPEIQYNLAAVLESNDKLETALALYKKAAAGGIERAENNVRNVGGKILAKKLAEQKAEEK